MDEIGPIAQDRLSGLPQEILTSIISKLDFNEAGRTCVLCQTFRNVWKTTKVIKKDTQPCSLHLQLPSLVQVYIHVNNPIKLVWKTSPTRLREKMINLPPS